MWAGVRLVHEDASYHGPHPSFVERKNGLCSRGEVTDSVEKCASG